MKRHTILKVYSLTFLVLLPWDRHTNVTVLNRLMGSQPLNKAEHSEVKFGNGKKEKIKS
jgi:hypothetical protein